MYLKFLHQIAVFSVRSAMVIPRDTEEEAPVCHGRSARETENQVTLGGPKDPNHETSMGQPSVSSHFETHCCWT